jgi:hypothetical protein
MGKLVSPRVHLTSWNMCQASLGPINPAGSLDEYAFEAERISEKWWTAARILAAARLSIASGFISPQLGSASTMTGHELNILTN